MGQVPKIRGDNMSNEIIKKTHITVPYPIVQFLIFLLLMVLQHNSHNTDSGLLALKTMKTRFILLHWRKQ